MSNALTNTAKGIGNFFWRWSTRITKAVKHRVFTQRKNVVIVGELGCPLYEAMYKSMHKHWEITLIQTKMKAGGEQMVEGGEKEGTVGS